MTKRRWTKQQERIIREGRQQPQPVTYSVLAGMVGRSREDVIAKAQSMGLMGSKETPAAPRDAQQRLAQATYERLVAGGMASAQARAEARKAHGLDGAVIASAAGMCADEREAG